MNRGSRIVAIDTDGQPETGAVAADAVLETAGEWETEPAWDAADEAPAAPRALRWITTALALAALVGWTGFFAWTQRTLDPHAITGQQAVALLVSWCQPTLLICVLWLLATRNSTREAARFSQVAHQLSSESERLESRLRSMNSELSLAREFITAQGRDLEALGRIAAERLSHNAGELQALIRDNGAQVDAIGAVSTAALANMEALRGHLPVIASSAKDITNNIATAGRAANSQVQEMIQAFKRINEFGQASEQQVVNLRGQVDEAIITLHQRFETMRDEGSSLTQTLRAAEETTLAAWQAQLERMHTDMTDLLSTLEQTDGNVMKAARQRMLALSQEAARLDESMAKRNTLFDDLMSQRRSAAEQVEAAAMAKLSGNLDGLDAELASRTARQTALAETLAEQAGQVAAQVAELETRIAEVATLGGSVGAQLADRMGALFERLANSQHALAETDSAMATLTDSSVRLLEIIQAGVQHSRDDLPAAIASGEGRLADMEHRIVTLRDTVDEANRHGESLSAYVLASGAELGRAGSQLEDLHARISERAASQEETLGRISGMLTSLGDESRSLADHAQGELSAAIAQLSSAAQDAVSGIENLSAATIGGIAARLGEESGAAIESAMRARTAELAGQVEQAIAHAAGAGREATIQLRDQLAKVNELASNLERRIAHARERAEDQLDNDFARRVALITDSLNSHAIDISKAMSADVADTAWAAYLRGDRGVFTRRAVSLIDGGEARSILQAYENDNDFRDHVSRYIHDFEAMLRQLLSTRDGHALGVTLLSSDMGKLYVALAQAIERLRA